MNSIYKQRPASSYVVKGIALNLDGQHYAEGATIELTAVQAQELGAYVELDQRTAMPPATVVVAHDQLAAMEFDLAELGKQVSQGLAALEQERAKSASLAEENAQLHADLLHLQTQVAQFSPGATPPPAESQAAIEQPKPDSKTTGKQGTKKP